MCFTIESEANLNILITLRLIAAAEKREREEKIIYLLQKNWKILRTHKLILSKNNILKYI